MKRRYHFLMMLAVFTAMLFCLPVHAEESGDWTYSVKDGNVTITAYRGSEKEVVIRFPVKEEGELVELVPNAEISVAAGTFEVKLKPYELKSFCWLDSREGEVKSVSIIGN